MGGPPPPGFADDLYARAEGNPFFTEQLVAAALAGPAGGGLRAPAGLPERLTELLVARAARCGGGGRAVLTALAVAGRPLTKALLSGVTGLEVAAVRAGLRELVAARLLAHSPAEAAYRPRHALLATAARLLPAADRSRYAEEYRSELWDLAQAGAGRIRQLRYAFCQLRNAIPMSVALRSPRRRSSVP